MCVKTTWKFYLFNLKAGIRAFLKNIDYFRFREYLMTLNEIGLNFNTHNKHTLLDIGCGEEVFGIFLAKTLNWDVSAIDVNTQKIFLQNKYLKRLKDKYTRFKAEVVDARRMPYSDNSFDAITCFAVAPLIEGDGDMNVLKEIARVLKDNGIAYVTVGYGIQYKEQWNTVSTRGFSRVYDEVALQERLIRRSGLILDKRLYFGHPSLNFSKMWYRLPFMLKLPFRWMVPLFTLTFLKSIDPLIKEKIDFSKVNGILLVLKKHKGAS
jgi:SAM-dependent methyltransferase